MDSIDLNKIIRLKEKAASSQFYDIAQLLKDAQKKLEKRLNEKYNNEILNKVNPNENI